MTDAHARDTRIALIMGAKDVFVRSGFAGATMQDIADAAGTTKRTLYKHFPTKADVFTAVVEAAAAALLAGLGRPEDYGKKPLDAVTIYSARYLELTSCTYSVAFQRMVLASGVADAGAAVYRAAYVPTYERLAAYFANRTDMIPRALPEWNVVAQSLLEAAVGADRTEILFGARKPLPSPPPAVAGAACDLPAIRERVRRQLGALLR